MAGDSGFGMAVGLTQAFPNGTYYSQYSAGGTSLSSPRLAGVLADADQAACLTRSVTLSTTRGFDSTTGIGSPGPDLIPALAAPTS